MRSVYLIAYDVCDPKRLRKTHKLMCGAGDPLQFSVFRCELSEVEKQQLQESLWDVLNLAQDRVMLVNLGPVGARGDDCIEYWGEPLSGEPDRTAVVA
ncbi:MAG: CRISPR-associated endonuclease Cas2 [Planctomycetes bacterium]|nr:CRISPR-associated endonuclease Cas2 [Planctomycetota bacterium]